MDKLLGHYKRVADLLACAGAYGAGLIMIRQHTGQLHIPIQFYSRRN